MLLFIIPAAVIFIVWCWATIMASSYGLIGRRMYATAQFPRPMERRSGDEIVPLSVIITAHNQAEALQRNLPHILNQEYGTFEVIDDLFGEGP